MSGHDPHDADIAVLPTVTQPHGRAEAKASDPVGAAPSSDLVGRQLLHFRVVARLGAGGMGVVYQAIDEKLKRPVALKVLAARYLVDDDHRRLLLREARSAAAVSHVNVATIHEVNESDAISFIAMEYVDGGSLRARLARGRVPRDEALRYAREIAAGLACAHDTGIVHRDLKPDNVMLTQDGHVKLLDFGLARPLDDRAAEPPASAASATSSASLDPAPAYRIAGTPDYMSPEQARGEPVDARSDVFGFGATLFELLTGERPFARAAANPADWELPRDWTLRPPLGARRPAIDRELEAIVARCLALRPEERYASGRELAAALEQVTARAPGRRARRGVRALFGLAALAAIVAGVAWWRAGPASPPPRAVAFVLRAQDVPADQRWIALAAERRVVAELVAAGRIRVVPAERAAEHPSAAALARGGDAAAAVQQLSRDLGVDRTIVVESAGPAPEGAVTLVATLYEAGGDRADTVRASGTAADALVVAAQLATAVRERLQVARPESLDSARAALPRNREAARRYAEGLGLRRAFDIDGARRALEQARDLDPDAPLVHDALAELWTYVGYEERAAAESRRALALAGSLRREDRLRVEARGAVAAHDWDRAIEAYRALALLIPDELDDALAAVETMVQAGRASDAASAVEQLARRPGGDADPRVHLVRAQIVSLRGNRALARDTARAARARALAVGLTGIVTRADSVICTDAAQSGEPDEAQAACQRAIAAYRAAGDVIGEAHVATNQARNQLELGRLAAARAIFDDLEPRVRRVGPSRGLVRVLGGLASLEQKSSHNARALTIAREAVAIARTLGSAALVAQALGQLASAELEGGKPEIAEPLYQEASEVAKHAGLWASAAHKLQNLALLHVRAGHFPRALTVIEASLALFRQVHESFDIAWALDTAGLIAINMNELDRAQAFIEEALAVRSANQLIGGQSRQNLAEILIEKGDVARAVAEASRAAEEFHKANSHDEIFALEVLARAQLANDDPQAALATAQRALAGEDPSRLAFLQRLLAPTLARARYGLGQRGALAELEKLVAEPGQAHAPESFGPRLALGGLLIRDGDTRRGRAMLEGLVADARAIDDALTAAQAARLLAPRAR